MFDGDTTRTVALPRGGTLRIRVATADDVDGLVALYATLDQEAVFRRFFSIYRPDRAFFERMVGVADGGVELVAVVTDAAGPDGHIVAEAGYAVLPNGNGELAVTVAREWRGWLGPYLLDALADAAARHGVANLEADVLAVNGPMLALLRARGYALLPTGDWTVVRAVIATNGRVPCWPPAAGGPRVLVEGAGRWSAEAEAAAAGMQVVTCHGPVPSRCPTLTGTRCPLAAGADAIVVWRPDDSEGWAALREAHPHVHAGIPVLVALPHETDVGADEIALPGATGDMVELVQRVVAGRCSAGS